MFKFEFRKEIFDAAVNLAKKCGRQLAKEVGHLVSTFMTFVLIAAGAWSLGEASHFFEAHHWLSAGIIFMMTALEYAILLIDCYALLRRLWKHANHD